MKRFKIFDPALFVPPRPTAWANYLAGMAGAAVVAEASYPSFSDFFATYFAGRSFEVAAPKCSTMLEGMKKCYENHASQDPVQSCQYYIQGFERFACGKK